MPSYLGNYNIQHNFKKLTQNLRFASPYLIFFHATTQSKKHWSDLNWHILLKYAINTGYKVKIPFWTRNEELCVKKLYNCFHDNIVILSKFTLHQIAMQIIKSTATISVDMD